MDESSATRSLQASVMPEELGQLFEEFSTATVELQAAHDALHDQVQALKSELEQKNEALERKKRLEALGGVAAGVAHEFRNPLGGIRLTVDALLEAAIRQESAGNTDEAARKARTRLEHLSRAVSHLDHIVEDLLTFARNDALEKTVEGARDLVDSAISMAFPEVDSGFLDIVTEGPVDQQVSVDRHSFLRVLMNLLVNARQAMDDPRGCIGVWWGESPVGAWFEVCDQGPGIPEENEERIFHPFASMRDGGTGLGLAIVHDRVEAHGGEIDLVKNVWGGGGDWSGARFRIVLPSPERTETTAGQIPHDEGDRS